MSTRGAVDEGAPAQAARDAPAKEVPARVGGERSERETSQAVVYRPAFLPVGAPRFELVGAPRMERCRSSANLGGLADLRPESAAGKAPTLHGALRGIPTPARAGARRAARRAAPALGPIGEQDATATRDEFLAREYTVDMVKGMLLREARFMPPHDYMQRQAALNNAMRAVLNEWLVSVHKQCGLRPETLFLTVNIVDRYLAKVQVTKARLQLVGVAATLVSTKFEETETKAPAVRELVYITAGSYCARDVLEMEERILSALEFSVAGPTTAHFLRQFLMTSEILAKLGFDPMSPELAYSAACPPQTPGAGSPSRRRGREQTAWAALELALLDAGALRHPPSRLAAAALYVSNCLCRVRPTWPETLARLSGHEEGRLGECAQELGRLLEAAAASGALASHGLAELWASDRGAAWP